MNKGLKVSSVLTEPLTVSRLQVSVNFSLQMYEGNSVGNIFEDAACLYKSFLRVANTICHVSALLDIMCQVKVAQFHI